MRITQMEPTRLIAGRGGRGRSVHNVRRRSGPPAVTSTREALGQVSDQSLRTVVCLDATAAMAIEGPAHTPPRGAKTAGHRAQ